MLVHILQLHISAIVLLATTICRGLSRKWKTDLHIPLLLPEATNGEMYVTKIEAGDVSDFAKM